MVKFYVCDICPRVRAVLMVAKAINLEFSSQHIDLLKGEQLKPEYLKINPLHTVPAIQEENGAIISDSYAIMPYLVAKYGQNDDLYPKDPLKRAKLDQILYYNSGTIFPRMGKIIRGVKSGQPIDPEDKERLYESLDHIEKHYVELPYLVGSKPTIADISLAADVGQIKTLLPLNEERFPKLNKWFKNIENEEFYDAARPGLAKATELMNEALAKL